MTPEELQLLIDYADYGADEKEAWLESDELGGVDDVASEREEIKKVRALIPKLITKD